MIHPAAVVDPGTKLGKDVTIAAYAVIEAGVTLGDGCVVHSFADVGGPPGHVKDKGEGTALEVGPRCTIREYVSLHRGSKVGTGRTVIGAECYFMTGSHVGHDCRLGDGVVLTNGAMLGGHAEVGDFAIFGGGSALHQYGRVGTMAMVGGGSMVVQDVPPYCTAEGNRVRLVGLNKIGLERRGVPAESIKALRNAYRLLFRTAGTRVDLLARARAEFGGVKEVVHFLDFIAASKRGVARHGRD
ncbi:MAG TPA: acyl-ACP--UDP-N-acetylglucosamine O-acyltransferase [Planctomycetota bacterium]|jgi:UDP-N-acetylglucosamine acyltransferase|nr:acyl-ACP--UDP-N-acetylglucosamine O-acyltransferase [Planctomycetota bacterium]